MPKSAASSHNRMRFIFLSTVIGLGTLFLPAAIPRILSRIGYSNLYRGSLVEKINDLLSQLNRHEITPDHFLSEVHKHYDDLDLTTEFNQWISETSTSGGVRKLYQRNYKKGKPTLQLFWVSPNSSHPPHAHHSLVSAQCVLKGNLHVREYDRIARIDPQTLTLRPVSDRILEPYDNILTTEYASNVHWFGANDEPAVVLNINVRGVLEDTFDAMGQRAAGRYYLDPTTIDRDGDLIVAPEIDSDKAFDMFANHALRKFPSPTG